MASFLHTMVRITDPGKSRSFYEALGFTFSREMDIVRDGDLEATPHGRRAVPGVEEALRPRDRCARPLLVVDGCRRVAHFSERSISSIRYPSGSLTKQIREPPSLTRYGARSGSIP